jgi:hypothetical protein
MLSRKCFVLVFVLCSCSVWSEIFGDISGGELIFRATLAPAFGLVEWRLALN